MSTFFRSLMDKRSALVYIDDILLLADEKLEMFELIKELHKLATKENLKLAPEKSFYMLLKVKLLGHEKGNNTIKPIPSKNRRHQNNSFTRKKRKMLSIF